MPPSKKKVPVSSGEKENSGLAPASSVSHDFKDVLKDSLLHFEKLTEEERIEAYGDKKFLDQFRLYFKEKNPALLSTITRDKLPEYLISLDDTGFKIDQMLDQSESFHYEFEDKEPEIEVMHATITNFVSFCKDTHNAMPSGILDDFAREVGFDASNGNISRSGSIKKIEDIYDLWKNFIDKKGISLTATQKKNIEYVLCPDYAPVERILVEIALEKILPSLSGPLRKAFLSTFVLPITAFTYYGDLRLFAQHWKNFLKDHAALITPELQKKFSSLIVTNGDIRKKLENAGRVLDSDHMYSAQEKYFVRVFSKIVTRQLFEEVKQSQGMVDHYFQICGDAIKRFPPYANHIYELYPYDDAEIIKVSPHLHAQLHGIEQDISQLESQLVSSSEEKRLALRADLKKLHQQREDMKWRAYLDYLASKDADLGRGMRQLYAVDFDFSRMSVLDQQALLSILVEHSLHDLIKNKAPELLGVDPAGLKQFVHDLFDLQKKEITLPSSQGPVHLHFAHKQFLSEKVDAFISVDNLSDLKNLPLSFSLESTPSSEAFFEQGALRGNQGAQLFDTFAGRNQSCVLGENYQVKLQKDGKTVQGYLSQYPPSDQLPDDGTTWYLYSHPVNAIDDARTLVTWDNDPAKPVTITQEEEGLYDIDILKKQVVLSGQAISSLVFAYVLGQQPVAQQKILEKKLGKLDEYIQKSSGVTSIDEQEKESASAEKTSEEKNKQEILESRKCLAGNPFEQDKESFGLVAGTRLFLKAGETSLPPNNKSDDWMHLEITQVDWKKKKITIKLHGGEYALSKEGASKTFSLTPDLFSTLGDILGETLYKVPAPIKDYDAHLTTFKKSGFNSLYSGGFDYTFNTIKWNGKDGYEFVLGEYVGKPVNYFGCDIEEHSYDEKAGRTIMTKTHFGYKVRYTPQGKIIVSSDMSLTDEKGNPLPKFEREMDINMFILFVTSKKLQPKADDEIQAAKKLSTKNEDPDMGFKQKKPRFSLHNIGAFFKNSMHKVQDSIKKYDEEKAEDLTDLALQNGDLFTQFGKSRGKVFNRVGSGFEQAGIEYYTTRDSRIWKKIEKWQKYYEQEKHYPTFFYDALNDMLTGKEVPHDMYKIPAMLLTIINKEKSPYARHFDLMGKGHRVNLILGKSHQNRYLDIMNTKIAELKANSQLNGPGWTVNKNEEIMKLEMKYIVAVIDGREHSVSPVHEKQQASKWSRAFAEKLDEAIDTKFGFKDINEKNKSISKTTTFEFAEFEYNRHLKNNKAAAAMPYFKYMAQSAATKGQWEVFQMHVVSSIMSGWFFHCVDGDTQGWIKDICRTRGFLPGLWAKDIHQQTKMLQLLNIFSQGKFEKEFTYKKGTVQSKFDVNNFDLGNLGDVTSFVSDGFKKRWDKEKNGKKFCEFLSFAGKDITGSKKLIDFLYDPQTSEAEKSLLKEYVAFGEESYQDIDPDIKHNYASFVDNNLTKCETVVKETMKYGNGEFDGKDSSEKAGPLVFRSDISQSVPQHKVSSSHDVVFFMNKFLSWFSNTGFPKGNAMIVFLKRLRTIQSMFASSDPKIKRQAEDMLRYSINGVIIDGNSSGRDTPPPEFLAGLNAFKNFFKHNLDDILSDSIVSATMGDLYAKDKEAHKLYSLGDWSEYVKIATNTGMSLMFGPDREKNAEIQRKYREDEFRIYEDLYGLANRLQERHNIENTFRKYNSSSFTSQESVEKEVRSQSRASNTGVAIKNPETIVQLETNLKGVQRKKSKTSNDSSFFNLGQ